MSRFSCLVWLEEVSSTQDFLKEREDLNCVVCAKRQTLGRGRYGRSWHSDEGGLYLSFPLQEELKDEQTLPLVVALSVCQMLEDYGFLTSIKWVNDVYVMGKKICGVLVEKLKNRSIVGIGINVNQRNFPQDLPATSMFLVSGKEYSVACVLFFLLDKIEVNLDLLKEEGFRAFREDIKKRLLFLDQEVILHTEPPVVGILKDISEEGYLMLLTAQGEKKVVSGDITLRGSIP
ncbi:biotin--[acetyl-CoA-carboxylase] ligase [Hydrogenobacter hydrogenophilus]|uniref:biotin--[biotin carboxyl-carrier protein] ligase n=1 Tax=Hydrogenobacter hydrogenophilus TaxID=35835 RepID=A0A285NSJ6_9AQUI|nr:biotin--[acetyl-CoA-carboxylase] ligase [Hydrogenobacter hydrogenophilus]SNZ10651.1 BirA family transcriptional regulator, biotin operon repressor / biotin-[acetyl-CoA-carboxylase] ligase [Hydrogenobacter hydrogenophilus]